jgi:DNA-binding NarL/FixJ family response regulator
MSASWVLKPDLVVLDIGLPRLDGISAAARIFRVSPATKIVFLSQENDPDIVRAARNIGASAYVHKLKAATELLSAIVAALRCGPEEFNSCPLCRLPAYT